MCLYQLWLIAGAVQFYYKHCNQTGEITVTFFSTETTLPPKDLNARLLMPLQHSNLSDNWRHSRLISPLLLISWACVFHSLSLLQAIWMRSETKAFQVLLDRLHYHSPAYALTFSHPRRHFLPVLFLHL